MALPTSRDEFKEYCLRALGKPVINIEVTDEQLDDRIDQALQLFFDYSYDGSQKVYFKYQVTQQDIQNKYIVLPENIIGAVKIFDFGNSEGNDIFNINYQIALNDMYTLTSVSMVPYYMAFTQLQLIQELLVGQKPLRYNRFSRKLYIDMDWSIVNEGQYIVVEAYEVIDPNVYTAAWHDRWLLKYAKCLIKEQWGLNLTKFTNVKLMGGQNFNGEKILNDAVIEKNILFAELVDTLSIPTPIFMG